jgi:DNA polymerase III subunit epsilon
MPQIRDYRNIDRSSRVFCAIDVETTGLDAFSNSLVELSCIKYINCTKSDLFTSLIDPGREIPEEAVSISGITNEMVKGQPVFGAIAERFLAFIGKATLVAHNAQFDLGFINNALASEGHSYLANDYIDTLDMARKAFPGKSSYALQALAAEFGIEVNAAHRAEDDARVCMDLFFICDKVFNPGGQISLF